MKPSNQIAKSSAAAKISRAKSFPIVGLGGSAGSFASLEKFFNHMPADSGMAFVIVMHLDPNHKGFLADLIQQYTAMPVVEAIDGMPIVPNNVYLIPPNKDMGIHNRKLLLLKRGESWGSRQPIDYFFQSLADDQWNKAAAIVFSGMGADGETGIRMIKEKLGVAMAQDPETAQYKSMPLAAIGTNLVDYVLSPEEMPLKLIQYMNHPVLADDASEQVKSSIQNGNSIQKILMMLRTHTGHDFSLYKKSTVTRRIDRRIAFHQLPDYQHYVDHLRENPGEINILFNELLIGVTKFFRDHKAFDSLKSKIGELLRLKRPDEPVRVWIAGCSTGEEAYSVAMLLMESLDDVDKIPLPKIQLFATDLDLEAIEHARSGVYHDNIVADVSPARIARFFVKTEQGYAVRKELREMIVFAQHNLIKDAPFTRLDLLCCRNVMIYLTTELQRKLIPIFFYSLNPRGIMFMGPAETIGGFTEMFMAIDAKWKLFERREGNVMTEKMIDFPFHVARQPINISRLDDKDKAASPAKRSMVDTYNRILLENFSPASVLINEKGDILYSNGKTGKYLELPNGEAVMNIHKMAREELKYVLGNLVHQAYHQKATVTINDIKLKDEDQVRLINLKAGLLEDTELQGLVLVVFEDKGLIKKNRKGVKSTLGSSSIMIEAMEKELVFTKQQLHSTIEQMETSLEELKATNEELQSTNEELQSTNEESLTTKEEMQSLNEELMTINMQYHSKAEELTRLNNDMKNLLDSTEIGTIFLDNNMDILRYTPQVRKLFNLIPTDVGRPITHVVSNFNYPAIEEDIREVIDKLTIKELEVRTKTHEWYKVRIMPYRTLDNFISGAVLTFTLITNYKLLEYRFEAMQKYASSLIDTHSDAALQLNAALEVVSANQISLDLFNIGAEQANSMPFVELIRPYWKATDIISFLNGCLNSKTTETARFKIDPDYTFELIAQPFIDDTTDKPILVMVIIKNVSDDK